MDGGFGGWEGENQPAVAGVDVMEAESVAEKGAFGFGVGGVDDYVGAGDHGAPFRRILARIVARGLRRFNDVPFTFAGLGSGLSIWRRGWSRSEGWGGTGE